MAKIVKNTTVTAINVTDVGVTIAASPGQYTIPDQDYLIWSASTVAATNVGTGALVVNDGTSDLSTSLGAAHLKGGEQNTSSNLGSGSGWFKSKVGSDLQLKSVLGTTNQVVVTSNTNDLTLSLPQSIATSSSPTFAGLTLTSFSGAVFATAGVLSSEVNLDVTRGGTGLGTLTANNLIIGAGTSDVTFIAPGTSGNILQSNGSVWASNSLSTAGVAPNTATYITVSSEASLTVERRLAVNATNLSLTDGGANSAITINTIQDIDTTATPTFQRLLLSGSTNQNFINASGTLDNATGNEIAYTMDYTVNKATSGNDTGLKINQTDTASPGTSLLVDLQRNASTVFNINNLGSITTAMSTGAVISTSGVLSSIAPGTSGNVLTSNGSTWTSAANPAGMSIGGTVTSGTTGSVLFVGAGPVLAQDNANFFWDDTNNRLGLGTATPTAQLSITQLITNGTTVLATGAVISGSPASTEVMDVNLNFNRAVDFANGALTEQKCVYIQAPTYGISGGSTLTTAATLVISGPPAAGTIDLTNTYGIWIKNRNVGAAALNAIGLVVEAPTGVAVVAAAAFAGRVGFGSLVPLTDIYSTPTVSLISPTLTFQDGTTKGTSVYFGNTATGVPVSSTFIGSFDFNFAPSANSNANVSAIGAFLSLGGTVNYTGHPVGMTAQLSGLVAQSAGTVTNASGLRANFITQGTNAGTYTTARSVFGSSNVAGTGTITTFVSFDSAPVYGNVAGTATTTIGFRAALLTKGAAYTLTNYAAFQADDQTATIGTAIGFYQKGTNLHNRFAGNSKFGADSAPGATIDVTGTVLVSSTLTLTPITAGSILFAGTAGLVSQDNSNLFWDDTNNRLGLGTASPSCNLDIFSNSGTTGVVVQRWVYSNLTTYTLSLTQLAGLFVNQWSFDVINNGTTYSNNLVLDRGSVGIGLATPLAKLHLAAGTTAVAPLIINSGTSLTTPLAGVIEFTTDDLFFTITTGAARKAFVLDNGTRLTSGRVAFATTNGRLTDDSDMTFSGTTLTVTGLVVGTTKISSYNGISTVSGGVPSELATVDLTTQAAAIADTTLYTPASTGLFRVSIYLQVTRAATTSSILGGATGVVIKFNDGDGNVAQANTAALATTAGAIAITAAGNTTATNLEGTMVVYARTGVAITYAIGYTSVGVTTMQFAAHLKVEAL